ncbi:MogA/MoaB family molybdenum cofactor biosynthesis protein [Agathobacter sp.]
MYSVGIITVSDKGAAGEREDLSGPKIREMLPADKYEVVSYKVIPDERKEISAELMRLCDDKKCNLVLTTGGTGFSPRDITPEATMDVAQRNAPGIAEALRAYSMQFTPRAMLGRGASVIRERTLIINLPGSVKAVSESMDFLMGNIEHGLDILLQYDSECGR